MVINSDRSLFVHDQATLSATNISLNRVMDRLASQLTAANPSDPVTAASLFARMWDAQNPVGSQPATGVAQCNGQVNNWPIDCRPVEGGQSRDPLTFMNQYIPIALVNRFDLRDQASFADCGEYRVIFANPLARAILLFLKLKSPIQRPAWRQAVCPFKPSGQA